MPSSKNNDPSINIQLSPTKKPDNELQQDQAFDSLGIVMSEIAHDFNNVLSIIFGYVEMALSELPNVQHAKSDLEHVLAAGDSAKELVARILTYSNRTELHRDEISIDKPVIDATNYIRDRFPANIKLQVEIDEEKQGKIMSNQTEIYQVVSNLCNNSLQAMPDSGGEIKVTLDFFKRGSDYSCNHSGLNKQHDYARISVNDSGCGMNITTIEKMYTPFFTTSQDNDSHQKRAGLGLTTVYNIISSLGGVIFVDSTIDKGCCFELCIPLLDPSIEACTDNSSSLNQNEEKLKILLIDDEVAIIEMAEQILQQNGYSVTSFQDGNKALAYFNQQPHAFSMVITDLIMPTISGTELAANISSINPDIPIILTTGFSERVTASSCEQVGISTVLNKPFSINDLLKAIENLQ